MKKRILCVILMVFIMGMSFTGCAGQFALFNRAHNFLGNLGGKWIGAVVFWVLGGPVLPITLFADVFLFNVIEFWAGSNPIAAGTTLEQTDESGNRLAATKNDDGTLSVTITEASGETTEFLLEREGHDFSMFDADGVLISSHTVVCDTLSN